MFYKLITPAFLKTGDKIGIAAPARKISMHELMPVLKTIESWGLNVILGKNLLKSHHQFAGSDQERAEDFQSFLDDKNIKAILCARGGYGSVKIIDQLDFSSFIETPKWIIGFSDITTFHSHIHSNFGIETLHAEMPVNFAKNTVADSSLKSIKKALFGEKLNYVIGGHFFNKKGRTTGRLTGGNLSMLYSLIGSVSDIDTRGKILFIEDLDEYLYHIDRMMMNLKRTGKLENLAGLVIGGMSDMNDNQIPFGKTANEIIFDIIKEYKYPVCYDFPAGHLDTNLALIMGRGIELEINNTVKISF